MNVSEIIKKFNQSKEDYRKDIMEPVFLEVPAKNARRIYGYSGFYIVKIPYERPRFPHGEISFTADVRDVRDAENGNYAVFIGGKGENHRVYYNDGTKTDLIKIKNSKIANIFREEIERHPERYDESVRSQSNASEEVYDSLDYVFAKDKSLKMINEYIAKGYIEQDMEAEMD